MMSNFKCHIITNKDGEIYVGTNAFVDDKGFFLVIENAQTEREFRIHSTFEKPQVRGKIQYSIKPNKVEIYLKNQTTTFIYSYGETCDQHKIPMSEVKCVSSYYRDDNPNIPEWIRVDLEKAQREVTKQIEIYNEEVILENSQTKQKLEEEFATAIATYHFNKLPVGTKGKIENKEQKEEWLVKWIEKNDINWLMLSLDQAFDKVVQGKKAKKTVKFGDETEPIESEF